MTPNTFLARLDTYSRANDPEGMLAFAEQHLLEVMPTLSASEMRQINSLGEWAAMVVSMREATAHTTNHVAEPTLRS